MFGFESVCVQDDKLRATDTTTWTGKRVLISVSVSSKLIEQPNFIGNSNPAAVVKPFVYALDGLPTQSKAQMKLELLEIETGGKSKLNQIFSAIHQRRCRKGSVLELEDESIEEGE